MDSSLWNSAGQNTGVGSLSLLQGIFPTQGSNPDLLLCRRILYQLSHKGSPRILEWVTSFQFSLSVMSNSLRPHGLQQARPPCPSPTARVFSSSCPLSQWCHPTISSSVVPFTSHLQCFPTSGSFPMSQFFASGGQSTGVSASASVLPMNIQDWFPLGWTGWIPCSPRDSQESSPTPQFKSINSLALSFLYSSTLTSIHDYWINHSLDYTDLCWQSNVSAV